MKNISSKLDYKIRYIKTSICMNNKFITRKFKYCILYTKAFFYFIFNKRKYSLYTNKIKAQKLCDIIDSRLFYIS